MHRFQITQLLMDLIIFLDQFFFDEGNFLFFQNAFDICQTQLQLSHVADEI